MRTAYPSDVTRIQFELIEHDLQSAMVIVDSKSVKNTDTAEEKGYDGEKNFRDKGTNDCSCLYFASAEKILNGF